MFGPCPTQIDERERGRERDTTIHSIKLYQTHEGLTFINGRTKLYLPARASVDSVTLLNIQIHITEQ